MAAAALLALDRGARDGFRYLQQVLQIDRRVPAGVILAVSLDADARAAFVEVQELVQRLNVR